MSKPDRPTDPRDRGGPSQPLLLVRGLKKHFPGKGHLFARREVVQAVDGISFSLMKGTTLGVVGESGCGKSTTARLLLHLIEPDAGDIVFDGDGVREVHVNTMEGTWTGLRNFLRPFRGVSKWYLAGYVAIFEWANNLKRVTDGFLGLLLGSPHPTNPGS